jgi:hypothetical protein
MVGPVFAGAETKPPPGRGIDGLADDPPDDECMTDQHERSHTSPGGRGFDELAKCFPNLAIVSFLANSRIDRAFPTITSLGVWPITR